MKILSVVILLMASLAFVLLGCSDNSSPLVSPTDQAISAPSSPVVLAKAGVKHSLTGSAHTYVIYDPEFGIIPAPKTKGGFYNVMKVNAIDQGAGKISGSFLSQIQGKVPEDLSFGGMAKVKADVIQLVVDETGTMAKVVCKITEWTPWPGTTPQRWMVMVFIDKGEGNSLGSRDQISAWWFSREIDVPNDWLAMTPQDYLDWTEPMMDPFPVTIPIDNGNIQVR